MPFAVGLVWMMSRSSTPLIQYCFILSLVYFFNQSDEAVYSMCRNPSPDLVPAQQIAKPPILHIGFLPRTRACGDNQHILTAMPNIGKKRNWIFT